MALPYGHNYFLSINDPKLAKNDPAKKLFIFYTEVNQLSETGYEQ